MALTSFLAKHAAPLALALTTAAQAAEPDYKEIRLQPSQAQQVENARKLIVCHERIMEDAFTRAVDKHKSTLKTLPRSEFEQRAAGEILEDLMYMEGTEDLSVPFEACNAEALGVGIDDIPRLTTAMKDLPDTPSADPEAAVAFLKKISEYHDFTSAHFDTRTMRDETPFVESRLAKKLAERIYDAPVTNAWALSACMDKAVRADIDAMVALAKAAAAASQTPMPTIAELESQVTAASPAGKKWAECEAVLTLPEGTKLPAYPAVPTDDAPEAEWQAYMDGVGAYQQALQSHLDAELVDHLRAQTLPARTAYRLKKLDEIRALSSGPAPAQ